jgi:hypothetical protein
MRARRAFWSGLNIVCGLVILVGAALMRTVATSGRQASRTTLSEFESLPPGP